MEQWQLVKKKKKLKKVISYSKEEERGEPTLTLFPSKCVTKCVTKTKQNFCWFQRSYTSSRSHSLVILLAHECDLNLKFQVTWMQGVTTSSTRDHKQAITLIIHY